MQRERYLHCKTCRHQGILTAALQLPDAHPPAAYPLPLSLPRAQHPAEGLSLHPASSQPPSASARARGERLGLPGKTSTQLRPHGFWYRVQVEAGRHRDAQHIASPTARCCSCQISLPLPKSHLPLPSCFHRPSSHTGGTSGWDAVTK